MMKFVPVALAAVLSVAGCAHAPQTAAPAPAVAQAAPAAPAAGPAADDNLNAVAWSQRASEHDFIFVQTYRDAQEKLLKAKSDPNWDALPKDDRAAHPSLKGLKPAVVLDIDETVLDNSPYQARLIRSGGEFNEAEWAAWCQEAIAKPMPGAVAFTNFAAQHGIAVIYISNRAKDLDEPTLANLRSAGFPVADKSSFLGLGTFVEGCEQVGSEKGCRRQLVAQKYRVLMQFGDQIADFANIPGNTEDARTRAMAPYTAWIGERWFVLPNPTYGAWESALFDNDYTLPREERRQKKLDALRLK
ncbi:5'-nucleotidase, lipoprotein e(P4) family [Luteibacter sp. UNCMF366Tsu5.1]|uniref:5'-nucleotidase, lipoprotein e(P4) family n=1 Tax=Luteibacter sp. UNCMF366Tsu5.1 TaxID=1502758 RepID=UPI00090904FF|nr:HAD family acid phosphatase [Luteibacter sp. UNCMF366Tsu5.1]SFW52057.1 5'-nucleotidase, lipoprotein e(P4) family [Luteibacter sp. UNCMF366Tsu5.1]